MQHSDGERQITVPLIQEYMGLQDFCIETIKHFAMGFE